ncbi:zinc finger protein 585A-like [Mizuhopecten yessoensis]|uniref:Zinc finger protein 845 n=1 Tax=Mizuhopecten yessoensis TaxID=6573 RepID=A0A210QQQ0_MIZYE|nr:zinc finger protein 585A-like [Mizuhopecten yessoensis]XP_021352330.1 zinc finger protein 585A-like [Mizuhopecten yessoensis]OWF51076.1 Zinc finger protein 845 [Mizuhopecten yessoensis]
MDVCSMNAQGDLQPTVVPDHSIGTDIWTSLTEMLTATGKEFVVLTADRKCREGTTFGSTLGSMFLDRNSDILTKFINFSAEHYSLADGIQISHDTYVTENKHLDISDLDAEGQGHNTLPGPLVKHLIDQDYKPINDIDVHQTNEELTIVSIPDNRMEIAGDEIVNLNSNVCTVEEMEEGESNENIDESDEVGKSTMNSNKLDKRKLESQNLSKMKSPKLQKGRRTLAKEKQRKISDRTKKVDTQDEVANNIRRSRRLAGARNSKFGSRTRQTARQGRKRDHPDSSRSEGGDSENYDHAKMECPACGTLLANQNNFVKHVLSDHRLEKKSRANSKKISWTVDSKNCPVCGQFAEPDGVNSHIFVHCSDVLKYPCNRCPFVFLKKSKLVDHQVQEHQGINADLAEPHHDGKEENAPDQYGCQECGLKFTTQRCLQEHMVTHDNKKSKKLDLECRQCSLHFKNRSSFKRHMKSHTDENVNKCNICEDEFSQKEDLKNHMSSHQGDDGKPYKCEICEKSFKSRSGKRMHKLFSHGDKGLSKYGKDKFECRFCGGILGSYHTLVRHEARHEQDNESQIQKMGSLMEMATCKVVSVEELRVKDPSSGQETDTRDVSNTANPETDTGSKVESVPESNNAVKSNVESLEKDASSVMNTELTQSIELTDAPDSEGTYNMTSNHSDGKKKRKFDCKICQLDFPSQLFLKEHKKIHVISGKSPYACDLCGKIFLRSLSLYKHRQLHDTSGKFTCKTCLKQFNSIESLRRHAKNHLDVKPFICTVCGKGCTEKRNLDTHMLVHTQKKEFICEVCGKAYRTQQQLKEHRYIHTGERPHKCKVCKMAFRSQDVLRNHMALHSEFKKFMCHTCGKTFRQQSCLITHQHTHSNEPTHVCNVCGQGCKSSGALNSHFVSFHLKPEDVASYKWSVHVCEVCNKMFGEKQDHERHMRTHTGEKPYQCEICQKTFADKSNLRSHIRNHNGDRSKKCQTCGKGFMFNRDLKKHMASHNNKMRVPLLDNLTVETTLQETIVPAVDNIVTVITQTDALPHESHDQLVPPVSGSYEMVTASLPLGSNLTANLPPMNAENISALSLMQEATMVHMGVYSNTGDLTWHSL